MSKTPRRQGIIMKLRELHVGSRETGFTLIELMVVVLIIGILAAIAIPVFLHLQKEGYKASVKSDVRNSVTNIARYLVSNPSASDLRGTATWAADAGATGLDNGTLAFATPLQATLAANLTSGKTANGLAGTNGYDAVVSENNTVDVYGSWENWRVYGTNTGVPGWVYAYYSNPAVNPSSENDQWKEHAGSTTGNPADLVAGIDVPNPGSTGGAPVDNEDPGDTENPGGGGTTGPGADGPQDGYVTFLNRYFDQCETGTVTVTATSAYGPVALMVSDWNADPQPRYDDIIQYEADGVATISLENTDGILGGYIWAFAETAPTLSFSGASCADVGSMGESSPAPDNSEVNKPGAWDWNNRFPTWAEVTVN